jgi:hypothetical protein
VVERQQGQQWILDRTQVGEHAGLEDGRLVLARDDCGRLHDRTNLAPDVVGHAVCTVALQRDHGVRARQRRGGVGVGREVRIDVRAGQQYGDTQPRQRCGRGQHAAGLLDRMHGDQQVALLALPRLDDLHLRAEASQPQRPAQRRHAVAAAAAPSRRCGDDDTNRR